jgi:hypothetical protein
LFTWYIVRQKHFPQVKSKKWKKQQMGIIFILVIWALLFGLLIGLGWDSDQIENEIDNKTLAFFSEPIGN